MRSSLNMWKPFRTQLVSVHLANPFQGSKTKKPFWNQVCFMSNNSEITRHTQSSCSSFCPSSVVSKTLSLKITRPGRKACPLPQQIDVNRIISCPVQQILTWRQTHLKCHQRTLLHSGNTLNAPSWLAFSSFVFFPHALELLFLRCKLNHK